MSYKFDPKAKYTKSHEWVRVEGDVVVIGVSDYAQHLLSDRRVRRTPPKWVIP